MTRSVLLASPDQAGERGERFVLLRLWQGLALWQGILLAHLVLYVSRSENASVLLWLLAAGVAALSLGVIVFALWFRPDRLSGLRARARRWAVPLIAILLVLLAVFGLLSRPEWLYAHIGLSFASTVGLLAWTLFGNEPLPQLRRWLIVGGLLTVAATMVRAYGLVAYPPIDNYDEALCFGWAINHLYTGRLDERIMYYGSHDIPHYYLLLGLWFRLVGPGFWQGRLFSLLMMVPIISFTALAARNLYGRATALATAAVLFGLATLMMGARIRHDLGLALALAVSLYLYSEAIKRERAWLHLLAGACMGWGWFAHHNATLLGIAMTLGLYGPRYLARLRQGRWKPEQGLLLYTLGGVLAACTVFLIQILPVWDVFLWGRQPRTPRDLDQFVDSVVGHFRTLDEHSHLQFVLILAGLAAMIFRRRPSDKVIATALVLCHLALGLIAIYSFDYLPIPLAPLYGIAVGSLFIEGLSRKPGGDSDSLTLTRAIVTSSFLLAGLGVTLRPQLNHLLTGGEVQLIPNSAAEWLLQNKPTGLTVAAENRYFFWLTDYRFVSPASGRQVPDALAARLTSPEAIWDDIQPDIFIIDPNLSTFGYFQPLLESDYLPSRGYQLVAEFPGERDPIQIYERAS